MKSFRELLEKVVLIKFDDISSWTKDNNYILAVRKRPIDIKDINSILIKPSTTKIQVADADDKDMKIIGELKRNDKSEKSQWMFIKK